MLFVVETIESVLKQVYDNIEYIIIDGGSNDGTLTAIEKYKDRIDVFVSGQDAGIADAFNKGLGFATGKYILYLNADDSFSNEYVVRDAMRFAEQLGYPLLLYGDCNVRDRDTGDFLYRARVNLTTNSVRYGGMIPHPSLFTNIEYFRLYGEFDTRFRIAMDYEWFLRGGMVNGSLFHMDLIVSDVRDGGVSTKNRELIVAEIITALTKNGFMDNKFDLLRVRIYFLCRLLAKRVLALLRIDELIVRLCGKKTHKNENI